MIPEICPISDLARDAKAVVERARQKQGPIVITQRGREVAVLLPIEVYRQMEQRRPFQIASPRLVNPEDAKLLQVKMTVIPDNKPDASI